MGSRSLTPITEQEYEAIEGAVMETARGRWFLTEFARRNRTADTLVLLEAIGRLEGAVATDRTGTEVDRIRVDLAEMARAIARTKGEIAAIQAPDQDGSRLVEASEALDGIVRTTERATSDILEAAEHVQEVAWTLREAGGSHGSCDELDRRATEIYTACSFQDLTAQRTVRIVDTLRYLEDRIGTMMRIWGDGVVEAPPAGRPAPVPTDLSQSDVDLVIAVEVRDPPRPGPARRPAPPDPASMVEDVVFLSDPVRDAPVLDAPILDAPPLSAPVLLDDPILPAGPALLDPPAEAETVRLPLPDAAPPARPASDFRARLPLSQAFRDIDALSVQERLLRFT